MRALKVFALFFLVSFKVSAQYSEGLSPFMKTDFLIAFSSKDYAQARVFAEKLAKSIEVEFNDRGLVLQEDGRLLFPVSEEDEMEPMFLQRGRGSEGSIFVSVERSDDYMHFTEGYYLVVVANGNRKTDEMKALLREVRRFAPDAYFKETEIYMGCTH